MKTVKKLFASLLAMVMVLSTGVFTAFAETSGTTSDKGTITISNATIDETYTIYKLFDAIWGETYTDSDGAEITPTAYIATEAQYQTLYADEDCVFDFEPVYDSQGTVSGYQVTIGKTKDSTTGEERPYTDEEVISYIKSLIFSVDGFPGAEKGETKTATSGTVSFQNLDFGYYYVTSTLGAVVSINTVNPTASIVDKNPNTPEPDNDPEPNEPVKDVVNKNGDSIDGTMVQVGDTLTYDVSFTNTGYYTENEDGTLASVVIKDAAPEGTKLVEAASDGSYDIGNPTYKVTKKDGEELVFMEDGTYTDEQGVNITASYTVDVTNGSITWTFTGVPKDYTVTGSFQVTVTEDAKENEQNRIDNTATLEINNTFSIDTNEVTNYVPDDSDPVKDVKFVENETVGTESDNGKDTDVDKILQYEITYKNHVETDEPGNAQKVEIKDAAPAGTTYVKDSAGVTILDADENKVTVEDGKFTADGKESTVTINVDANGEITWTVETLPVNYTVIAFFRVKVTKAALGITDNTVRNTADVTIDNNSTIKTNEVHNPVPEEPGEPGEDPHPGKVIVQPDGTETQISTGSFGEKVTFDLGINAVNYVEKKGAEGKPVDEDGDGETDTVLVKEYYLYDKMDPGFTLDSLDRVVINGETYDIQKGNTNDAGVTTWTAVCANGTTATFYTKVDKDGNTIINGTVPWALQKDDGSWSPLYPNC